MKNWLFWIGALILCLIQTSFWPINWGLLLLLVKFVRREDVDWPEIFILGIILDLFQGTALGLTSLVLLVIFLLWQFAIRRFGGDHPFVLASFAFIADLFYHQVLYKDWRLISSVFLSILFWLLCRTLLLRRMDSSQIRLETE